jgi:predicted ATPase
VRFTILDRWGNYPNNAKRQVFLTWDDWNDYSFLTLYGIFYVDEKSEKHNLGGIKIGYFGQKESERRLALGETFDELGSEFFSVGVDVEYYEKLNLLGEAVRDDILIRLRDIAKDADLYDRAILEEVTKVSFLRSLSETTITGQFRRLASGGSKLTRYSFKFVLSPIQPDTAPLQLEFIVEPKSNPPTNIHVLIGRNGVGKTFIINNMIESLTRRINHRNTLGRFVSSNDDVRLFANLICVTFSAFDEFDHPPEQRDKSKELQYTYIGLKAVQDLQHSDRQTIPVSLRDEFVRSVLACKNNSRVSRWKRAISMLESDPIFRSANITSLIDDDADSTIKDASAELFRRLSSGHKIILLTITRLVEAIQERSLVLFDEPESHLHPPLLSSFINAVSDLLINRNGVAIIATHSPVILQEVPSRCVWKLRRNGAEAVAERLQIESFGENVGVLTQEIFGLEVTESGFHKLLKYLVKTTSSYDEAIEILEGQIGLEGKSILRSLSFQKDKQNENNT